MGLPIGTILTAAKKAAKVAGRASGVLGKDDRGAPVKGRKKRLVAAILAVLVAYGVLGPEQGNAVQELVLALMAFGK